MTTKERTYTLLFYAAWLVAALLQAYFTPLHADEAYYRLFATQPAWGYFDHPPMIAWLIGAGTAILPGEIGVRIIPVLLFIVTIALATRLVLDRGKVFLLPAVASVAIMHVTGFIATPDTPLLFFSVLFLLAWRRLMTKESLANTVLLALATAAMILSKYHGVLIVGLAVIANYRLLRNRAFLTAALFTALLLIPHLIWQITHDFPTFRYHLAERSDLAYRPVFTLKYLLGQLLMFGPLMAPMLLFAGVVVRHTDPFDRTLRWVVTGFLLFFLLMSLRGSVEPHWTLPAIIPAIIRLCNHLAVRAQDTVWFRTLVIISVMLFLPARLLLGSGGELLLRHPIEIKNPFADPRSWTEPLSKTAGVRATAFMNSYQNASLYAFYTGKPALSLNNVMGRKNQFDIWQTEERYRSREVVVVLNYTDSTFRQIHTATGRTVFYGLDNDFQPFSHLQILVPTVTNRVRPGATLAVPLEIESMSRQRYDHSRVRGDGAAITVQFFRKGKLYSSVHTGLTVADALAKSSAEVRFAVPDKPGTYTMRVSVSSGWLPPSINSYPVKVKVARR
jgi:hypothetical protein